MAQLNDTTSIPLLDEGLEYDQHDNQAETKTKSIEVDCRSCLSTSTLVPSILRVDDPVVKTTFQIASRGRPVFHLPTPSKEMLIRIFDATGAQSYTSIRSKRCSGSSILNHAEEGDLLSTTYKFGWTDPILKYLSGLKEGQEIQVHCHVHTRTTQFTDVDGISYRWKYKKLEKPDGSRTNTIALCQLKETHKTSKKSADTTSENVLARLIRDHESRFPGTNSSYAGNGGRLDLYETEDGSIDECVIIATCMLMLKRELDRRRALQIGMLSAAV